jgi:hypothetical protein
MPYKTNADRRHHIPRPKRRVTNWAEYDAALRQRGSLTVWFTEEAIAAWRAEPAHHAGWAAAVLRPGDHHRADAAGRLALRQTEGLIGSIIGSTMFLRWHDRVVWH